MAYFAHVIFWIGCAVTVYSYAIYPLILLLIGRTRRAPPASNAELPAITVIITARNEEKRIGDKLVNTLQLDYPRALLNIFVASDASSDGTDEIVKSYADRGVTLIRSEDRKGKENAQLHAIKAATTPLLVFTDVATRLTVDTLTLLAQDFSDPAIGAVSSEDELIAPDGEVRGEGAYVRYEMWLRRLESRVAGLVGLSGSCFAVRREICNKWRIDTPSDITVALLCSQAGKRAISDDRVKGSYQDLKDESKEFSRKKRTIVRGMTAVWELRESLNPFRCGLFAFQVWSHKIFRWLVPAGMILAFMGNLLLLDVSTFYRMTLVLQCAGYLAAVAGHMFEKVRASGPVRIVLYFVVANIATAAAGWDFLRGVRITTWNPSQR